MEELNLSILKRRTKQDNYVVEGYFISRGVRRWVNLKQFGLKYSVQQVDSKIDDYQAELASLQSNKLLV